MQAATLPDAGENTEAKFSKPSGIIWQLAKMPDASGRR
jgi:hypothetical protein